MSVLEISDISQMKSKWFKKYKEGLGIVLELSKICPFKPFPNTMAATQLSLINNQIKIYLIFKLTWIYLIGIHQITRTILYENKRFSLYCSQWIETATL